MNNHVNKNKLVKRPIDWKPCSTELIRMKRALDKLVPKYEEAQNFGLKIKAKRIFKKAMQISKRITVLLGGERMNHANNSTKEKTTDEVVAS